MDQVKIAPRDSVKAVAAISNRQLQEFDVNNHLDYELNKIIGGGKEPEEEVRVQAGGTEEDHLSPRMMRPPRNNARLMIDPSGLSTNLVSARTDEGMEYPFRSGPSTMLHQAYS